MAASSRTRGEQAADTAAAVLGSWRFIIVQTVVVLSWIATNILAVHYRWDPYPFILLNLAFSTQAAYAAPLLQLASNRAQSARQLVEDRQAAAQLATMEAIHALVETVRADIAARDASIDDALEEIHELLDEHRPEH